MLQRLMEQAFAIAVQHHQQGRFTEAERTYRQVLSHDPNHVNTLHLLGILMMQTGRPEGEELIRNAITLNPREASFHSNLGSALSGLGRHAEAVEYCREAVRLNPALADAHYNLGNAHMGLGNLDAAESAYQAALRLQPSHVAAHHNLGYVFRGKNQMKQAEASYREAIRLAPEQARFHVDLSQLLIAIGSIQEAKAACLQALRLQPAIPEAHVNLGIILKHEGLHDEAVARFLEALRLQPANVDTLCNLGTAQWDSGRLKEAIETLREAVHLRPDNPTIHSNLIMALYYDNHSDANTIKTELAAWNQRHAAPLAAEIEPHKNDPSPERRLRLAYLSPDFRNHPVGRFFLPLLKSHDREKVEVVCYYSAPIRDAITDKLQSLADEWHDVAMLSEADLAKKIRADKIDILVDLSLHSNANRLLTFARKPAPVQVTWLGYAGSTGIDAMDYRLTDPYLDPTDTGEYSEKPMPLAESYWCYNPPEGTPEVNALPADATGRITFGCLNNVAKMSEETLAAWGRLLQRVKESTLLLNGSVKSHRERVMRALAPLDIHPNRVSYLGQGKYFDAYNTIDIGLDPFPFAGATTTCDALWMGVPVITIRGKTAVGRTGVTILSNIGLPELIANDVDEYIETAARWAADLPTLRSLRATLRQRLQSSPVMNAERFSRNMESAFRQMWIAYCKGTA